MKVLRLLASVLFGFGLGFVLNGMVRWLFGLAPWRETEFDDKLKAAALAELSIPYAGRERDPFDFSEAPPVSACLLSRSLPHSSLSHMKDDTHLDRLHMEIFMLLRYL